jgi:hypothetical protein
LLLSSPKQPQDSHASSSSSGEEKIRWNFYDSDRDGGFLYGFLVIFDAFVDFPAGAGVRSGRWGHGRGALPLESASHWARHISGGHNLARH